MNDRTTESLLVELLNNEDDEVTFGWSEDDLANPVLRLVTYEPWREYRAPAGRADEAAVRELIEQALRR